MRLSRRMMRGYRPIPWSNRLVATLLATWSLCVGIDLSDKH